MPVQQGAPDRHIVSGNGGRAPSLSIGLPGSYVVCEIEPAEGGGSRLHITWDRRGKTVFGKLFVGMLALTRGILIRRSFQMGLTRMAATQAHPDPAPSHGPQSVTHISGSEV